MSIEDQTAPEAGESASVSPDTTSEQELDAILDAALDKVEASESAQEEASEVASALEQNEPPKGEDQSDDKGEPPAKEEVEGGDSAGAPPENLNLSAEEREAWGSADPKLRSAFERRVSELERGLEGYRNEVEAFSHLKPVVEAANGDPRAAAQAFANYHNMEQQLLKDPAAATVNLMTALQRMSPNLNIAEVGLALMDHADQIGHEAEANPADRNIQAMQREVAEMRQQMQQRQEQEARQRHVERLKQDVQAFREAEAPRYEELQPLIAGLLNGPGIDRNQPPIDRLRAAYQAADRMVPQPPNQKSPEQRARTPDAAKLSVSGPPSAGSNPAEAAAAKSAEDAVEIAMRAAGL